jgi:ABC-type uncharacterized transport system permease subunit
MSDSSTAIAQSLATSQAAATQRTLQTEMLRQQSQSDQAVITMLQQSAEQSKATLLAGQGENLDITA